jgi:hypothetical protein
LRNGYKIQGFEQKICRKISGPKKAELSEKFRTLSLSNKRIRILCVLPSVVTILNSTARETRNIQNIDGENVFEIGGGNFRILLSILEREILRITGERSLYSVGGYVRIANGGVIRHPRCSTA